MYDDENWSQPRICYSSTHKKYDVFRYDKLFNHKMDIIMYAELLLFPFCDMQIETQFSLGQNYEIIRHLTQ